MKTVPLIVYENGERKIIGHGVVEIKDGFIDVTGKLDDEYVGPEKLMAAITGINVGSFSLTNVKKSCRHCGPGYKVWNDGCRHSGDGG